MHATSTSPSCIPTMHDMQKSSCRRVAVAGQCMPIRQETCCAGHAERITPRFFERGNEILQVLIAVQLVTQPCTAQLAGSEMHIDIGQDITHDMQPRYAPDFCARATAASVLEYVLLYTEMGKPFSATFSARFCAVRDQSAQRSRPCMILSA